MSTIWKDATGTASTRELTLDEHDATEHVLDVAAAWQAGDQNGRDSGDFGILEADNRVPPAMLQTSRGLTWKVVAPMRDQSTPATSEYTTEYETDPETGAVVIPLRGTTYPGLHALVDSEDLDVVRPFKWWPYKMRNVFYAVTHYRAEDGTQVYTAMHRMLLGITDRRIRVDHINHNGLDNRKANLRTGTQQQNAFNARPQKGKTSRYKGVCRVKKSGKWSAQITKNRKHIRLGEFENEVDAAKAYDAAAREHFGEFAYLNFPEGQ